MKNLKISKTFVALALVGTIAFVGCAKSCKVKEEHYHIYTNENNDIVYSQEERIKDFEKKDGYVVSNKENNNLIKEGRYPYALVIDEIEAKVNAFNGKYVEGAYVETFKNKKGKIDFNTYWRFLSNDELEDYLGIIRYGDTIKYVVFDKEGKRYEVDSLRDLDGEYYIDEDEFITIVDPVEVGSVRKMVITNN